MHQKEKQLKRRILMYQKIYRRNPHLWDIDEYEPAHYYPYTALQLKRNPQLVVPIAAQERCSWTDKTVAVVPRPYEGSDFQVTWDFFHRCYKKMNEVEMEMPEMQALMRKLKTLPRSEEGIHAFKRDSDFGEVR